MTREKYRPEPHDIVGTNPDGSPEYRWQRFPWQYPEYQPQQKDEVYKDSETVSKRHPGGMANYYDDSWLSLLRSLQEGKDPSAAFTEMLQGFKGDPADLENFFDNPVARMAFSFMMSKGKANQLLNDFDQEPSQRAFASGAGRIGQAAEQAKQSQMAGLSSMGLGRSGLASALQGGIQAQAGSDIASLGAGLEQQRYQNLMGQARSAFDAERVLTQLALGQTPAPMEGGGGSDSTAAIIGAAGTVLGSFIGAPWLGAAGAAAYSGTQKSNWGGEQRSGNWA